MCVCMCVHVHVYVHVYVYVRACVCVCVCACACASYQTFTHDTYAVYLRVYVLAHVRHAQFASMVRVRVYGAFGGCVIVYTWHMG